MRKQTPAIQHVNIMKWMNLPLGTRQMTRTIYRHSTNNGIYNNNCTQLCLEKKRPLLGIHFSFLISNWDAIKRLLDWMFKLIKQRLQSTYSLVGNNSPIVDLIPFPARYLQFNSQARTQTNLNNYTFQARGQIATIWAYE